MLTINEIFHSIQGESTRAGQPCVFVRLTACDLRCTWCDTPYAFHEGRKMSVDEVVAAVEAHGCPLVEITGGEPLLQEDVYPLMERLLARGQTVMLETGGHRPIARVPAAVVKIVDVKCPGSGEAGEERLEQPRSPRAARRGEVRHPGSRRLRVRARRDRALRLPSRAAAVLISPVHGVLDPQDAVRVDARRPAAGAPAAAAAQVHLVTDDAGACESGDRRIDDPMRAVVLLSGGLDSYTAAAIAKAEGFTLYALTIHYGQRHAREVEAARAVARALGVERHLELDGRPARDRRLVAHLGHAGAARSRSAARPTFRRPTCRRATRSFCRSRSAGPKCSARATSSSASTRSTIPAIPTAGPEFIARVRAAGRRWRRGPASRARASACTRRC